MAHERTQQERAGKKKQYQQPDGFVAKLLWRIWMHVASTFVFSMLDTWEIILIFAIVAVITVLVTLGLMRFIPHAMAFASFASRTASYPLTQAFNFNRSIFSAEL